jgi:hypothetical protein
VDGYHDKILKAAAVANSLAADDEAGRLGRQ